MFFKAFHVARTWQFLQANTANFTVKALLCRICHIFLTRQNTGAQYAFEGFVKKTFANVMLPRERTLVIAVPNDSYLWE